MIINRIRRKKDAKQISQTKQVAYRVSVLSILLNILLLAFKLIAGIVGHSGAMISDAVHSASDVLSTFVVMIGVSIAGKASDDQHQYGHDRLECVAAIILALLLCGIGIGIGITAVKSIIHFHETPVEIPGMLPLIAAMVSIIVKEGMYWITRNAAKKINSGALKADAWHHRSDALSSVGSLIGIAGARLGFPVLDPIAAGIIALLVIKVGFDIAKESISKMLDTSIEPEREQAIYDFVAHHEGVVGVDLLRTRKFGSGFYVDLEIAMDGDLLLKDAHALAEHIHKDLERDYPDMKHCMIHINPAGVGHTP